MPQRQPTQGENMAVSDKCLATRFDQTSVTPRRIIISIEPCPITAPSEGFCATDVNKAS